MKSQDSKQKIQYLDRLLTTYYKSVEKDEADIKKHKEDFINQIKKRKRKGYKSE